MTDEGRKRIDMQAFRASQVAQERLRMQIEQHCASIESSSGPARTVKEAEFRRFFGFQYSLENIAVVRAVSPPTLSATDSQLSNSISQVFSVCAYKATSELGIPEDQLPPREEVAKAIYRRIMTDSARQFATRFFEADPIHMTMLMDKAEETTAFGRVPSRMNIYTSTARIMLLSESFPSVTDAEPDPITSIILREMREITNLPDQATIALFRDGSSDEVRHLCAASLARWKRAFLMNDFSRALSSVLLSNFGFMAASVAMSGKEPDELVVMIFGDVGVRQCVEDAFKKCVDDAKKVLHSPFGGSSAGRLLDPVTAQHLEPYFFDPRPWTYATMSLSSLEMVNPGFTGTTSSDVGVNPVPFIRRMNDAIAVCRVALLRSTCPHKTRLNDPSHVLNDILAEKRAAFLMAKERMEQESPSGRSVAQLKSSSVLYALPIFTVSGEEQRILRDASEKAGEWVFSSRSGKVPLEALSLTHSQAQMDDLMLKFLGAFRDNDGFMRDVRIGQGLFIVYRSHQALQESLRLLNPDSMGYPGIEASLVITTYRPRDMTTWASDLELSSHSVLMAVLAPHMFPTRNWAGKGERVIEVPPPTSRLTDLDSNRSGNFGIYFAITASRMSSYAMRAKMIKRNGAAWAGGNMPGPIDDQPMAELMETIQREHGIDPMEALTACPSNHNPMEAMDMLREAIKIRYASAGQTLRQNYSRLECAILEYARLIMR